MTARASKLCRDRKAVKCCGEGKCARQRTLLADVNRLELLVADSLLDSLTVLGGLNSENAGNSLADDLDLRELGSTTLSRDLLDAELSKILLELSELSRKLLSVLLAELVSLNLSYKPRSKYG